ncbi:hypothetical protein E2P81_ATG09306 [Venturia nashicola]|uniref:Uncharacterized protein n=1 Tax=Venturia nashicola TaxID=86259 RepID=A0A4Z1NNZ3_9PEZI|nr:hypothetical protein E6O75_ATG09512 [Venturia nashicola]TLD20236.1 hypothetical protein E2P81_ATG09306 [Venturia nashicola]
MEYSRAGDGRAGDTEGHQHWRLTSNESIQDDHLRRPLQHAGHIPSSAATQVASIIRLTKEKSPTSVMKSNALPTLQDSNLDRHERHKTMKIVIRSQGQTEDFKGIQKLPIYNCVARRTGLLHKCKWASISRLTNRCIRAC